MLHSLLEEHKVHRSISVVVLKQLVFEHLLQYFDVIGWKVGFFVALAGRHEAGVNNRLFEELFLPNFKKQNDWVHRNTGWKTWQHTCGSVTRIIPLLIETGLDILNPVQTSAAGMDPAWLKREFGSRITFWGGGVDTQRTLPFATAEEVEREVADRIRTFAPGGGFVFNTIHNIQQGTPPENIMAAYETARRVGRYPIE